jgi:hypothetical protein
MAETLGPLVLNVKANVSYDESARFHDTPRMDRMSETEEKAAFIGRVRAARAARFEKQGPMCVILGIDQGTYKQYETRTPLPHRYIPKFCAATFRNPQRAYSIHDGLKRWRARGFVRLTPTAEACADVRAWQRSRAGA